MPAPTEGLITFYNMSQLDGGNMDDLTANGNDGAFSSGSPSVSTGTVSNARHFTTGASFISLSTVIAGMFAGPATICAWVKTDGVGATRIGWYFQNDSPGNLRIFGHYLSGATTLWVATGATLASSVRSNPANANIVAGKWYHIAVTYAYGKASAIYAQGTAVTYSSADNFAQANRMRHIGNNSNGAGTGWTGDIDEFRYYSRILNSTEINNVFADTTSYPEVAGAAAARRPSSRNHPVTRPRWGR